MATPFYTLGEDFGADRSYYHTPFVRDFVSPQVPRGEFERWLGSTATGGNAGGFDRKSQFLRSLYGQTQSGYQAALLNNPGLTYRDYLQKHFADTGNKLWAGLSFEQRGERPGQFSPRTRVLGRA
jgi:hypothetical protein